MKNLVNIIESGCSDLYDINLLKKEYCFLKTKVGAKKDLLKKVGDYNKTYKELLKNFNLEFKILNKRNYELMKAVKTSDLIVENDIEKNILIEAEKRILIDIKSTFQTIINKKEKVLRTYKLLEEATYNEINKKEIGFSR